VVRWVRLVEGEWVVLLLVWVVLWALLAWAVLLVEGEWVVLLLAWVVQWVVLWVLPEWAVLAWVVQWVLLAWVTPTWGAECHHKECRLREWVTWVPVCTWASQEWAVLLPALAVPWVLLEWVVLLPVLAVLWVTRWVGVVAPRRISGLLTFSTTFHNQRATDFSFPSPLDVKPFLFSMHRTVDKCLEVFRRRHRSPHIIRSLRSNFCFFVAITNSLHLVACFLPNSPDLFLLFCAKLGFILWTLGRHAEGPVEDFTFGVVHPFGVDSKHKDMRSHINQLGCL